MRDLLPPEVFSSIRSHLRLACEEAPDGWASNKAEEDSLTGDLGRLLRTKGSVPVLVDRKPGWQWSIRYNKFRGRGPGAFEHKSGADGIVQIEVSRRFERVYKGVLFQAKKEGRNNDPDLNEQLQRMEAIAPGGSGVFVYGPNGYSGLKGAEYLHPVRSGGFLIRKLRPLSEFLDDFLECKNGIRGMYLDAVRELLLVPTISGELKAHEVEVRHRVKILVTNV